MYNTEFCKVDYLSDKNAILCQWKQFCRGDDYRNPLRYGLELIEKTKADTWITDTTYGFENELADTQWLIEEYMPQVIGSTINKIIFIIQQDSPLMREIEAHLEQLSSFFEVKLVDNYIIRSIL